MSTFSGQLQWPLAFKNQLKHVNPKRTFISITIGNEEDNEAKFPPISAATQYLSIFSETNHNLNDFLAQFTDLQFFKLNDAPQNCLTPIKKRKFSINSIKTSKNLQYLDLSANIHLDGINALSNFSKLQLLNLSGHRSLAHLNFVKNMKNLRQLNISGTNVSDLSPLNQLSQIEFINSNNTLVKNLPVHLGHCFVIFKLCPPKYSIKAFLFLENKILTREFFINGMRPSVNRLVILHKF